ncbi:hypothetical protein U1Q18_017366 [Sarracenia purpurea var. burkii]
MASFNDVVENPIKGRKMEDSTVGFPYILGSYRLDATKSTQKIIIFLLPKLGRCHATLAVPFTLLSFTMLEISPPSNQKSKRSLDPPEQ